MQEQKYDAIVVGSGFGGSVAAYELAAAGKKVLLLERGKAYPPNSFARSPDQMRKNFWDPSAGLFGMFNIWSFSGMDAVVSSGLGGGSLIYANVQLRMDKTWFQTIDPITGEPKNWPVTYQDLEAHYQAVEEIQNAQTYPHEHEPYSRTPKMLAFKHAAEATKRKLEFPPLAVTFRNQGADPALSEPIREPPNLHNMTRYTCRLCGECDIGCNHGSKNTLDFTFLSRAKEKGLEIRTLCEVTSFKPTKEGWDVEYRNHSPRVQDPKQDCFKANVSAKILLIAAGTLGSNYLLLKNKESLKGINQKQLGNRFSGNGDLLHFLIGAEDEHGHALPMDPTSGPVISCMIRIPDVLDGGGAIGPGFYVQDAGYPALLAWMAQAFTPETFFESLRLVYRNLKFRMGLVKDTDIGLELSRVLSNVKLSSYSTPTLSMGRDAPEGRFFLNSGGHLDLEWTGEKTKAYVKKVYGYNQELADALHAKCVKNPLSLLKKLITVHPLGGCAMSEDATTGVTNRYGRVFLDEDLPPLFVVDGAALPGPVGANPALTIAANSRRIARWILDEKIV